MYRCCSTISEPIGFVCDYGICCVVALCRMEQPTGCPVVVSDPVAFF